MSEIYVSTDVETDGPIPGPHSMLSFASAAFTAEKRLVGTFSCNLETLPDAKADPKTAAWWQSQPQAWAACRADMKQPAEAMHDYLGWLKKLPGKPVFVGYPVAFDFMFVYCPCDGSKTLAFRRNLQVLRLDMIGGWKNTVRVRTVVST